jgi:hypothetical protein
MTGLWDRIVRLLALWALTVGYLGDGSHAFTASPRPAVHSQTQTSLHHRAFGVVSLKEHTTMLQAKKLEGERPRFHLFRSNKQVPSRMVNRFRRSIAALWMAALLMFGSAALHVAPSYASPTAVASTESIVNRIIPKGASLDRIVDRYVKDHMFDDDVYDPVESAYREAYEDVTTGKYPRALNEVASSLLGSDVTKSEKPLENVVISFLTNGAKGLQSLGLSALAANVVVYGTTLVGAPSFVLLGILSYANMQKRMRIRQNKKRYGEDYRCVGIVHVSSIQ